MSRLSAGTKFACFLSYSCFSCVFVLFAVVVVILLSAQNAFTMHSTVSGVRVVSLIWNTPESGADHYRLEITKMDRMREPTSTCLLYIYTQNNFFHSELEEGYSYTVRIQAVSSYGVYSDFSLKTTFSLCDKEKTGREVALNNKLPTSFSLFQNHPNPFNTVTTITYSLPNDTHVKLIVYNICGQKVKELQNRVIESGTHSVTWDAWGMPSGAYFYTLMIDGIVESKKMLLVK